MKRLILISAWLGFLYTKYKKYEIIKRKQKLIIIWHEYIKELEKILKRVWIFDKDLKLNKENLEKHIAFKWQNIIKYNKEKIKNKI